MEEERRGAESEVFEVHCEVPAFERILRTLNFHLLKSFIYGDVDLLFQLDVACCQSDRTTTKWFAVHDITVLGQPSRLARPEPNRESMRYCQEEADPKNTDNLKAIKNQPRLQ